MNVTRAAVAIGLALGVALASATSFADPVACRVVGEAATDAGAADAFTRALSHGPLTAAAAAFVGGLAVSLTPCVYPMIAVTVSVFGARQSQSRRQGLALSAAYVLGIVAMFVPAGVVAAMTGGMFGAVLQNRWVLIGISAVFLALAASMFGAFELTLPSGLLNRLSRAGGLGYRGAFVLGLVSGLIAAPCTGPVLTGILLWIAKTQSPVLGGAAMGAFALGLGVPFFLVGAFAIRLPKSGRFMVHVKSALGLVLTVVALYFASSAFPAAAHLASRTVTFLAAMGALILLGIALGAVHRSFADPGVASRVAKGLGIVAFSLGSVLLILALGQSTSTLAWETSSLAEARDKATRTARPLLVDFTATWCEACKKLDRSTFSEASVAAEAGRFVAVKVDATHDDDPAVEAVKEELRVVGLPTVLLFDSDGREAVRCTDFVPPESFLEVLRQVQ